ncbi:MAG: SET domain-containing protein [Acidobacteria bacterium]|nr:SET domain-containing protein [Acidobacteriota bacterium]
MSARFKVRAGKSRIEGTGVFAVEPIPARRKIGELAGEIISQREARRRAKVRERIAIVEFGDGKALDADSDRLMRYINHSCDSNCYIRLANHRVEFYSRRAIGVGEELSADYGETHHVNTPCRCGAVNCRGML